MSEDTKSRASRETLAIPEDIRQQVDERDRWHCRVCGKFLGQVRALHHIHYGGNRIGMGGRREHDLDNLITVCWMWGGNCHDLVHSNKGLWVPLLEEAVTTAGVTAFQLRRWAQRRSAQRR